jgi:hypothetical protein
VATSSSAATVPVRTTLINPDGQVASIQSNGGQNDFDIVVTRAVVNHVGAPLPGRWRMVVRTVSPSSGHDLVVPFTGTVSFDDAPVSSADLAPFQTGTAVPVAQGSSRTVSVQITNDSATDKTYVADPRTAEVTTVELTPFSTGMPAAVTDLIGDSLLVPPMTTQVAATVTAPIAVQAQLTGPSAPLLLSGPNALGPVARPDSSGRAVSTAVLTASAGPLTPGHYGVLAGSVGPFGPDGAPPAVAFVTAEATTRAFDTNLLAGDPFAPGTTEPNAVTIPAGQTATLTLTLTPTAAVGTQVDGVVNIVQLGVDDPYSTLVDPALTNTMDVIAALPYRYVVTAAVPTAGGDAHAADAEGSSAAAQLSARSVVRAPSGSAVVRRADAATASGVSERRPGTVAGPSRTAATALRARLILTGNGSAILG